MTTAPDQLFHLLSLLEDDSPPVRQAVMQQLVLMGPVLADELKRLRVTLTAEQRSLLQPLLDKHAREWLKHAWPTWQEAPDDKEKLEAALAMIGDFLSGRFQSVALTDLLDDLTQDFHTTGLPVNPVELSRFLFHEVGLNGVAQEDYYNPQNSNLMYVLEHKRGIPISLACIYMLIGHRLGLPIEGCNFPGHFMAIATMRTNRVLVDCFNGGRIIGQKNLDLIHAGVTMKDLLQLECRTPAIVARVLRNLVHAFQQNADPENADLIKELLRTVEYSVL